MLFALTLSAHAQMIKRTDAIWARSTAGAKITLDGKLTEAVWAKAESIQIRYGASAGIPGSGWRSEGGQDPPGDPTVATLKFLVDGNYLYIGGIVKDSSVGGSQDWARWDGWLMSLKDRKSPNRPTPPTEAFYTWWYPQDTRPSPPGRGPRFIGDARWANWEFSQPRDSAQKANWDAVTTVQGLSNDDSVIDTSYTVEMRFNLAAVGYDATRSQGDIIEWNISIWDCDWYWPNNPLKLSSSRVWWQGPWGNAALLNEVRIHVRPDVTVNSGPVPTIGPEAIIPNGVNFPAPTIDGKLTEPVWRGVKGFDIRFGDAALRNSYPGVGPYRSGQFQPAIDGKTAAVLDPGDATIKWFFKNDTLYLGVDVRDQVVQGINTYDRWDGIRFTIEDRAETDVNDLGRLIVHDLIVRIDSTGKFVADGYLPFLRDSLKGARVGAALKGGTTVNNFSDVDSGYTIELAIDLTKIGYPAGRGDGVVFMGVTLFDGDSFDNPADNYGTRTWWFRENVGAAGPAWVYMDPTILVSVRDIKYASLPREFALLGNYPNPFNPSTTIRYMMPEAGHVTLRVFDVLGRQVTSLPLGIQPAGEREAVFDARNLSSGTYFYQLQMFSKATGKAFSTPFEKMVLIK